MSSTGPQFSYNSRSLRVKQAKLARLFRGWRERVWQLVVLGLLLGAASALIKAQNWGYLLLALGAILTMLLLWYRWWLRLLPSGRNRSGQMSLDQLLAADIVSKLAKVTNPQQLWRSLRHHPHFYFVLTRFGLDPALIETQLSSDPADLPTIWQTADALRQQIGWSDLKAVALIVALVLSSPKIDSYLAQLQLEPGDLGQGLAWLNQFENLLNQKPARHGGIARDWAFGFTPLLNQFGINLSRQVDKTGLYLSHPLHQQELEQVTSFLTKTVKNSVALVGETGVGKSTLILQLAERLLREEAPTQLKFHQIVSLNPSLLTAYAKNQSELESLLLHLLAEAAEADNIILFLDDAHIFFSEQPGGLNLTTTLLPILQNSAIRLLVALRPADWQQLSTSAPELVSLLNFQAVKEPDSSNLLASLQIQAFSLEAQNQTTITYQALRETQRLAERYVQGQAFPGKAVSLLTTAVNFAQNGLVTAQAVQAAVEGTYGVKVSQAGPQERRVLINLEAELHRRLVNQELAVKAVADALRRARAGVRNPNRPVGSFLFLGPTGVGKTELAKALAVSYFGSAKQIITLDMTEYSTADDAKRMLATANAGPAGLGPFLSRVRSQPFGVVLLDEVEKAHPDVINLLLQMLEEGRITDSGGQTASFKEALIIATSNAGADQIRRRIEAGENLEQFRSEFIDDLINRKQFLPELLNRFDEIVLFRPLTTAELKEVLKLLLAEVNLALEPQRVKVSLTEASLDWLIEQGNDPRLGARPLRRLIQRTVENVVSERILEMTVKPGQHLQLDVADLAAVKSPK